MKKILIIILVLIALDSFSQKVIPVATDKTSSLIFPFPILHIDRGTKDILVQEIKESDNILLLKAGCKNFHPTNLSVLTSDGSVYSFLVEYDSLPSYWVYKLPTQSKSSIETYTNSILDNKPFIHGVKDHSWGMHSRITGIYIKENTIYYQLLVTNDSPIDYDIDYLRFYIRDKKKSKRTASQENELKPLYIAGNTKQIPATSNSTIVIALEKFTIPDAKFLAVEIGEKNGGRNLLMKVNNNKIIQAVSLPDLK